MASMWTGNLSSPELLALRQLGVEPLGQVYGASVQGVSSVLFPITTSEVKAEVAAFLEMLEACTASVREQAEKLGANRVLNCRLTHHLSKEARGGYFPYKMELVGLASKDPAGPRNDCSLSAATPTEFVCLVNNGFDPCGLAVGFTAFYQVAWRQPPKKGRFGTWANEEVSELTQGPYTAREIASNRMVDMAKRVGAAGVVGVNLTTNISTSGTLLGGNMSLLCRMMFIGTAIRRNLAEQGGVKILTTISVA